MNIEQKILESDKLLQSIKASLPELTTLLEETDDVEDGVYRFYHQSIKVYRLQSYTEDIIAKLQTLAPHLRMNEWLTQIVTEGTGRERDNVDNDNWLATTRHMVEAYFHARYFLEMVCKYGQELDSSPMVMPSGWAAVLYLFDLR